MENRKAGKPDSEKENIEIVKCGFFGVCRPDICPGYIELTDWQGCALQIGEMGVTEALRDGARALDQIIENIRQILGPRD